MENFYKKTTNFHGLRIVLLKYKKKRKSPENSFEAERVLPQTGSGYHLCVGLQPLCRFIKVRLRTVSRTVLIFSNSLRAQLVL